MNTPVAIALPLLAALLWLLTRRRPQGPITAAPLASQPISRLVSAAATSRGLSAPAAAQRPGVSGPKPSRRERLGMARAALVAAPELRLQAVAQLGQWGDRGALPLLQRGLRDPHPAVVLAAAQAMERFRGRTAGLSARSATPAGPALRLPRNARPQP